MSEAKAERSSPNPDHGNTDSGYLCAEQLAIVERFEHCIDYLYPVLLGIRRAHHVVRDATVSALFLAQRRLRVFERRRRSRPRPISGLLDGPRLLGRLPQSPCLNGPLLSPQPTNPMTINTRADLDALKLSDPAAYATFVAHLKGSLTRMADTQQYPADYNHDLKPGDNGYLAPVIAQVPDATIAERFGFTAAELQAM